MANYEIDWGEGKVKVVGPYNSNEIFIENYSWSEEGNFTIRARAEDLGGAVGEWGYFDVTMPKNKAFNFNLNPLNWLFERFPLLQRLWSALGVYLL